MNLSMKMSPNPHFMLNAIPMEPVSRTYQYRKIMKPMLERKRRARINKCLDELKDLMTGTLQADGENVSKLEKADILELTVRHLHRLRENNALFLRGDCNNNGNGNETLNMDKFWAGFQHCAAEVAQFLNKYDRNIGGDLMKYIACYIPNMTTGPPSTTTTPTTPSAAALQSVLPQPLSIKNAANYQGFSYAVAANRLPAAMMANATIMARNIAAATVAAAATAAGETKYNIYENASGLTKNEDTFTTMPTKLLRYHPYARAHGGVAAGVNVCAADSGRDSGGDDGRVWRPW